MLRGCRECLPRSIRFGEDVYDRDPEEITDFDLDAPNRGRDPAPSSRIKDELGDGDDQSTEDSDEHDEDSDEQASDELDTVQPLEPTDADELDDEVIEV